MTKISTSIEFSAGVTPVNSLDKLNKSSWIVQITAKNYKNVKKVLMIKFNWKVTGKNFSLELNWR